MECKFVLYQQVVCIYDQNSWYQYSGDTGAPIQFPVKNGIYTIVEIEPYAGTVFLRFKELTDLYNHKGFRPLESNSSRREVAKLKRMADTIVKKLTEPV